jgi:hypothetical protein
MTTETLSHQPAPDRTTAAKWTIGLAGALVVWIALYSQLLPFSEWAVSLLPIERQSHLGEALAFFIYDTPKVIGARRVVCAPVPQLDRRGNGTIAAGHRPSRRAKPETFVTAR